MDRRVGFNVPCLVCVPEESTVVNARLEGDGTIVPVRIPGINMRIKVDHGYGAVDLAQSSKDREDLLLARLLVWIGKKGNIR